jgi:hypothetical protein
MWWKFREGQDSVEWREGGSQGRQSCREDFKCPETDRIAFRKSTFSTV